MPRFMLPPLAARDGACPLLRLPLIRLPFSPLSSQQTRQQRTAEQSRRQQQAMGGEVRFAAQRDQPYRRVQQHSQCQRLRQRSGLSRSPLTACRAPTNTEAA